MCVFQLCICLENAGTASCCAENVEVHGGILVSGIVVIVFGLFMSLRLIGLKDEAGSRS